MRGDAGPAAARTPRLADALVLGSIATLPFTQALTLDVGFPLKVYELLLPAAATLKLLTAPRLVLARLPRLASALFLLLLVLSAIGLAYVVIAVPERPLDPDGYRLGGTADGVLQLGYLTLAGLALLLVADLAGRRPQQVVVWWLRGAVLAAAYALVVNASVIALGGPLLLPGGSDQRAVVGAVTVYRAGPFLEGNFFGLYLLISLILALVAKRFAVAVLVSIALVLSLSTPAVAAAGVLWMVALLRQSGSVRGLGAVLTASALGLALLISAPPSVYRAVFLEKITDPTSQSAIERRATAVAGLRMVGDHPFTGVGISQYGAWFPEYRPAWVPSEFLNAELRYVPNNVYVQVLAENGLVVTLVFVLLLATVVISCFRSRGLLHCVGIVLVIVSLNAFPSTTVVFVWAYFGLLLGGRAAGGAGPATPVGAAAGVGDTGS